jgi:Fur family transcriptional regulator, ferric uptake regulator
MHTVHPASLTLLQKLLKDSGYSMTAPRKVVCELLWEQEPLSMRELTERSKGMIDRASLYRTIALFEQLGLVQRIYIGWKYKVELSDVFTHHHHHISCLGCGKIVAITEEDEIERLITALASRHGFTPQSHQLEVTGYCGACTRIGVQA